MDKRYKRKKFNTRPGRVSDAPLDAIIRDIGRLTPAQIKKFEEQEERLKRKKEPHNEDYGRKSTGESNGNKA